jgi:hypothetical protein
MSLLDRLRAMARGRDAPGGAGAESPPSVCENSQEGQCQKCQKPPWPPGWEIITQAEAAAIFDGSADYPPVRPAEGGPCYYSQHHCRWRSKSGVILCGICVPPAHPGVVAEWLDRDS